MTRIVSPFGYRTEAAEVVKGLDLSGTIVVLTGAASGIGIETARALSYAGAAVYMPVRSLERGEAAMTQIGHRDGSGPLEISYIDLANQASVRRSAQDLASQLGNIDILITNAAVMATPFSHTDDGFELQFGTNHLGHFTFFQGLLPALLANGGARVVALSSIGHRRSDVVFDDPNFERSEYDKWSAYGQSKTANALFAVGVTERYADRGVFANAVHPGGIMTGLQKSLSPDEQRAMGWFDEEGNLSTRFKTVAQGAATSVWAAVGSELENVGGRYLEDCNEALPFDEARPYAGYEPYAVDPARAQRLWQLSEALVA